MKIEIFKGGNGQYYFNVKSANGEKIAQSEGYTKKQSAEDTIKVLKEQLPSATVVEIS